MAEHRDRVAEVDSVRFTLSVPGAAVGKERARFSSKSGRAYTPKKTVEAEDRVVSAWEAAGSPTVGDGPLRASLVVVLRRPKAHWRADGSLSAAGIRSDWPLRKPDADNVFKLVADSLNGLAYRDDSQFVDVSVAKVWARPQEDEHVRLTVQAIQSGGVASVSRWV